MDAISSSALACLNVLLGEQPPKLPSLSASESATQVMYEVALEQSKYWKCINETMREGREGMGPIRHLLLAHSSIVERTGSAAVIPISGKLFYCQNMHVSRRSGNSDILKAHRAYYLYYTCNLVNTELTNDKLQNLFEDQVFCS